MVVPRLRGAIGDTGVGHLAPASTSVTRTPSAVQSRLMDRRPSTRVPAPDVTSVLLNGDPRDVPSGSTVADLVDLVYTTHSIAIARNGEVVPRSAWSSIRLEDADRLEVLSVAPGG
jgi:sulfur carrier protein